ncbi:hypothetical protein GOP47_0030846, partial [Adiantum capillus-veneris]
MESYSEDNNVSGTIVSFSFLVASASCNRGFFCINPPPSLGVVLRWNISVSNSSDGSEFRTGVMQNLSLSLEEGPMALHEALLNGISALAASPTKTNQRTVSPEARTHMPTQRAPFAPQAFPSSVGGMPHTQLLHNTGLSQLRIINDDSLRPMVQSNIQPRIQLHPE